MSRRLQVLCFVWMVAHTITAMLLYLHIDRMQRQLNVLVGK